MENAKWAFCSSLCGRTWSVWRGLSHVWAGISAQGKTDLHVIDNGTLTPLRYVNEILDVYVRPYAGAVGENFILMDDNARAHRAPITDQYLEQATIIPYGMAS